jgi:transcriptional antiterminator Rof (Rho-off)
LSCLLLACCWTLLLLLELVDGKVVGSASFFFLMVGCVYVGWWA